MENAVATLRSLSQRVLQRVHPLIDSFVPVTYTAHEFAEKKRRLDPDRARNRQEQNARTDDRLCAMLESLDVGSMTAERIIAEARAVRLRPVAPTAQPDLASPMCFEDRYAAYAITRAIAPNRVVETGIAHGVSSTYILAALAANGADAASDRNDAKDFDDAGNPARGVARSRLVSIDRSDDPRIGQMVPLEFHDRWTTHIGNSLDVLPAILAELGTIDLFIHDSLHHYRHVRSEFDLVWPHLRPGGVLMAHDILQNNAFPRFLRKHRNEIDLSLTNINLGLIRKRID